NEGGGGPAEKVLLCHNQEHNPHTISVGAPAQAAHERHGDALGPCEEETPEPGTPEPPEGATLTTDATDTATLPDGTISDTATLSGATSDATGTISFSAYGPFDPATDPTTDVCDETTLAFESPDPVDIGSPDASGNYVVSSDDPAVTTDDFVPTEAGRYQWVASYSGDDANDPVTSECNAEGEQSVVDEASSTTGTEQNMTLAGEIGEDANLADPATDTTNIEGTTQNGNTTLGTDSEDDVLYGNASANKLLGRHGNDYLDGGKGRDRLVGGKQADRINGADGKPGDVINGGIGIDYCVGDVGDEIKNCDGNVVNVPLPSEAAAPAEARN
ncbi:MAG: calcium-binding protein, partial [Rubrobacteraceae bacterium]